MNPLDQLHDIATPDSVSIWPLAWGWWILLLVSVIILVILTLTVIRHIKVNRARKQALTYLQQMQKSNVQKSADYNALLKRVAIAYASPTRVSRLFGNGWHQFLYSTLKKSKQNAQIKSQLAALTNNVYQTTQIDVDAYATCQYWLKNVSLKALADASMEASHV